jgi:CHAT domain-containing protein
VAEDLGRRRLIIVRDSAFSRIPFEALPDPRELAPRSPGLPPAPPLMASNAVVYAPSASVLAKMVEKSRRRTRASKRLAAFGAPGYLGDLELLPDSRTEVENITGLLPEGQFLKVLGFETQRERFLELVPELAQYQILHIATHSIEDQVFPELSSLVFSLADEKGQPRNGLLTYYEISDLDLPLDMVVLSACRTGSGKEIKGEGVLGLGRAFLHAGVSRVVVSLWDVDDEATAYLMQRFYEGMFHRDLSPPEALRQARLAVRSQPQWQAPYYWAPFVLEGDWN